MLVPHLQNVNKCHHEAVVTSLNLPSPLPLGLNFTYKKFASIWSKKHIYHNKNGPKSISSYRYSDPNRHIFKTKSICNICRGIEYYQIAKNNGCTPSSPSFTVNISSSTGRCILCIHKGNRK